MELVKEITPVEQISKQLKEYLLWHKGRPKLQLGLAAILDLQTPNVSQPRTRLQQRHVHKYLHQGLTVILDQLIPAVLKPL